MVTSSSYDNNLRKKTPFRQNVSHQIKFQLTSLHHQRYRELRRLTGTAVSIRLCSIPKFMVCFRIVLPIISRGIVSIEFRVRTNVAEIFSPSIE